MLRNIVIFLIGMLLGLGGSYVSTHVDLNVPEWVDEKVCGKKKVRLLP